MFSLLEGERLVPNLDGSVTLITQSGQEHTYDPDDFKHDIEVFDFLLQYEAPTTIEGWRAMLPPLEDKEELIWSASEADGIDLSGVVQRKGLTS